MKRYIIGIAGGSGSGKSTFAKKLQELFPNDITLLNCDNYYHRHDNLSLEECNKLNYDSPDSIDFALLIENMQELIAGNDILMPIYDFNLHNRSDKTITVKAKQIILLDGILAFYPPQLLELFDLKIFVDTDADERILRRAKRDINERGRSFDSVVSQYLATVKPMHNLYVEPTKNLADIIIKDNLNEQALDLVALKIKSVLSNKF